MLIVSLLPLVYQTMALKFFTAGSLNFTSTR